MIGVVLAHSSYALLVYLFNWLKQRVQALVQAVGLIMVEDDRLWWVIGGGCFVNFGGNQFKGVRCTVVVGDDHDSLHIRSPAILVN